MKYFIFSVATILSLTAMGQDSLVYLWPDGTSPKSEGLETSAKNGILWIENVQEPTLEVYLPSKQNSTGQGVLICPGGGYQGLAYDWEGTDIAKWLNANGIAGFVLKYRLPNEGTGGTKAPHMDAKRGLRIMRANATRWNLNPDKIGVMGFSAGGHLASTLGTQFGKKESNPVDDIDELSDRPDFMILMYPVISMAKNITHGGSRKNLIGENPNESMISRYSSELNITSSTPPTLLIHSADDEAVPVENSIQFFLGLKRNKVPAEMHVYPEGGHGYSLAINNGPASWPETALAWLRSF